MSSIFIDVAPTLPATTVGPLTVTGQLLATDGTAANPSISFAADNDTGIYNRTANNFTIAAGGSNIGEFSSLGLEMYTGSVYISNGTAAGPGLRFDADQDVGLYRAAANDMGIAVGGIDRMRLATSAINCAAPFIASSGFSALGTIGGESATPGFIGEYASSTLAVTASSAGTTVWTDMIPLTLTPGDWDVTLVQSTALNGATCTALAVGISSTSGNSATGLVEGDNWISSAAIATAAADQGLIIPNWRRLITTTTTYYAKFKATLAAGSPTYMCRFSARRVR